MPPVCCVSTLCSVFCVLSFVWLCWFIQYGPTKAP